MKREIIKTGDGSTTIQITDWNEQYHSIHGAIQEARHVFIEMGLQPLLTKNKLINILEIGFGTGLNVFVTLDAIQQEEVQIFYTGVEAYPVIEEEIKALNYSEEIIFSNSEEVFKKIHATSWENFTEITPNFHLRKQKKFFQDIDAKNEFNIIYFDAFGARVQPDLWTFEIFKIMYAALKIKGVLVTYSAKGSARRALQEVGFTVERLQGPPGKREMLRATKF